MAWHLTIIHTFRTHPLFPFCLARFRPSIFCGVEGVRHRRHWFQNPDRTWPTDTTSCGSEHPGSTELGLEASKGEGSFAGI